MLRQKFDRFQTTLLPKIRTSWNQRKYALLLLLLIIIIIWSITLEFSKRVNFDNFNFLER